MTDEEFQENLLEFRNLASKKNDPDLIEERGRRIVELLALLDGAVDEELEARAYELMDLAVDGRGELNSTEYAEKVAALMLEIKKVIAGKAPKALSKKAAFCAFAVQGIIYWKVGDAP